MNEKIMLMITMWKNEERQSDGKIYNFWGWKYWKESLKFTWKGMRYMLYR